MASIAGLECGGSKCVAGVAGVPEWLRSEFVPGALVPSPAFLVQKAMTIILNKIYNRCKNMPKFSPVKDAGGVASIVRALKLTKTFHN